MYNLHMEAIKRLGLYTASRITNTELAGVIFREQCADLSNGTSGLNAHIELSDGRVSGIKLYLPNECGRTARGYICTGETEEAAFWIQHSLPVIFMLYEQERNMIVYEPMTTENIEISGSRYEIIIPYDNEYNSAAYAAITNQTCTSPYLAKLAIAKTWMELIASGREIFIELEEWINQPDTHGSLRLIVNGNDGGVYQWPFNAPDNMPYVMCLPSLFPWANIHMDEDYYRSVNMHDPEENKLLPYMIEGGEIAKFRFRLELNSLGHAFLSAESFICRGIYPSMHSTMDYGHEYESGLKYLLYHQKNSI